MIQVQNYNAYADSMINEIVKIVENQVKRDFTLESGIVKYVNDDGTVDVYFPPETEQVFTRISNQTPFQLNVGDGVEIALKNGSYSNCWVIAKHKASNSKYAAINELEKIANVSSYEYAENYGF